jgi:hypothetical protein
VHGFKVNVLSNLWKVFPQAEELFPMLDDEIFYSRNLAGIVAGALIAYFCIQKLCRRRVVGIITALLFGALIYLNLLPDKPNFQTLVLSCIHMPFFFWTLLGIAFLGGSWRDLQGRMDYVRYNGELLIYSTIVLIGGMVLTKRGQPMNFRIPIDSAVF